MASATARRARTGLFHAQKTSFERLDDAAHIADGARGRGGTVGHVVEGLDGDIAGIAVPAQRREQRRKALLALAGAAAVAIVDLHVRDDALRQPAVDERRQWLLLHAARRAAF